MKPIPWGALALGLLAGLAQAASLAAPGSGAPLWWLQLPALAVLVALLDRSRSPRSAAALGLVFATAWMCGTFWWLFISMHTYGGLAAPLAALAVLALAAFVALYYAVACAAWRAWAQGHWWWRALVFAALWLLLMALPLLAVGCRRMHDIGRSGIWFVLGVIIPWFAIISLALCCLRSAPAPSR